MVFFSFFFFKQKTAYEITYGDWSSDVCSSDLATANASCTASSATSMSPKTRIRAATDRPDSSRKIRPTSASSSFCAAARSPTLSGLGYMSERADLDRLRDCCGGLRCPSERGVEVFGLDDVEAAEMFLRLRKGAVG